MENKEENLFQEEEEDYIPEEGEVLDIKETARKVLIHLGETNLKVETDSPTLFQDWKENVLQIGAYYKQVKDPKDKLILQSLYELGMLWCMTDLVEEQCEYMKYYYHILYKKGFTESLPQLNNN